MTVGRIRLYKSNRKKLLGDVVLDGDRLTLHIEDERERDELQRIFDNTGEVTVGWAWYEGEEPVEHRAQPRTPTRLWVVVANILYPMGYQADFGVTEGM